MNICIIINQEINQCNLNFLSLWLIHHIIVILFNSDIVVVNHTFEKCLDCGTIHFRSVSEIGITVVDLNIFRIEKLVFGDRHVGVGEATGLADADLVTHGHLLDRLQVLDQNVFVL